MDHSPAATASPSATAPSTTTPPPATTGLPENVFYVGYPEWEGINFYRVRRGVAYPLTSFGVLASTAVDLSADGRTSVIVGAGRSAAITVLGAGGGLNNVPGVAADPTCGALALSPGGDRVVFGSRDAATGRRRLEVVEADGSNRHVLATGTGPTFGCLPRWSGDGSTVGHLSAGALVTVRADGTGSRTHVIDGLPAGYVIHGLVGLSWDGTRAILDGKAGACACPDRRYWGISLGDPYVVDLTSGRAARLTSPDGPVVGAVFDRGGNLLVRVRDGQRYAIELLSAEGAVLQRQAEPPQEGTVTDQASGKVFETVNLVGFAP
jgi:hypothetical protein